MKHWQELGHIAGRVARLGQDARPGDTHGAVAALTTVTRIEGSAYRRPGAKLLIEPGGSLCGGVSGGCLEEDVRRVGLAVMAEGRSRQLHYETGDDENQVWGLGLGCDGKVDLVVQPIAAPAIELFARVTDCLAGDVPFALGTVVDPAGPGGFVLVGRDGPLASTLGEAAAAAEAAAQARAALRAGASRLQAFGGGQLFAEVLTPPPRLLVCGAGDDARPLVAFAAAAGFRVLVADHRPAFLTGARFPEAHQIVRVRAEQATAEQVLGGATFAVVKTHSFEHDRKWVTWLLAADASRVPYVGLLGPRARADKMKGELDASRRARLYAPVGLDLGADGPEQVALSVVSELLAVWSGRAARHLREREGAVHDDAR